jgi:hypothetical protein
VADGVEVTAGSGTTVSTDDAGASGHVQRVKLAYSADGSATHVQADADGVLVNLGANNDVTVTGTVTVGSHAVTNAGTFAVQVDGAALTALQLIDDAVYTDGTGTPSKAVAVAGTDGTNPQILKTDSSGELQVDIVGGITSVTEYTEGDTDASISGTAIMWEDGSDTLRAVSASKPLPVDIQDSSVAVTNTGTFATQVDGAALTALQLIDDPVATTASAIPSKGMAVSGTDGTNARVIRTDTAGVQAVYNRSRERNTYFFYTGSAVHVAAASTLFFDMFNADASLVVRIIHLSHIVNLETAVTGVGFEWLLERTTAVGTTGTALTAWLPDTSDTALDADITARLKAGGGATQSTDLFHYYTHSEETLAGNQLFGPDRNLIPFMLREKGIVLRQNQGVRINQETNSNAGNSAILVGFTVE